VVNNQNKQSTIFESRLQQVHKFMNPVKKTFKNLPKRLEWNRFYVNDLPIIMEICEDIRQIFLENQLDKSKTKVISEVKKTSAKAFFLFCSKISGLKVSFWSDPIQQLVIHLQTEMHRHQ
jgi:hypothetical protein